MFYFYFWVFFQGIFFFPCRDGICKCILQQCLQRVCSLAMLVEATEQDVNFIVFLLLFLFSFFFFWHSVQSAGLFFFFFFSFWCLFIMWNFSCSVLQFPFLNTFFLLKGNRTKYAAKEMILTFAHFAPWLFFFILLPAVFYGGYYYHDGDADSCMHIYK